MGSPRTEAGSEARALRAIEGQTVRAELFDGQEFEARELLSSGGVETLSLLGDGKDILVSKPHVTLARGRGRPVR